MPHDSSSVISLIRTTPPTPPWLGDALARSLREIADAPDIATLLRYHRFVGTPADREAGSRWLAHRLGAVLPADRIIVTNGTQNALFMAIATIVGRDGLLLTEQLSYYGLRRLAGFLGIRVAGVAMDADGADPDAFAAACRADKPKALFLMPTIHNPTTIVMSRERRLALAAVARAHGVAIVEDDVYGMLPREAPPPIAALAPDVAWYATGLAKCVAPGRKIGYLAAPSAAAAKAVEDTFYTTSTWFVSPLSAAIAQRWIADGTALRLMGAVREEAALRQVLAARILAGARYTTKPEALHLWLDLPRAWSQPDFIAAARARGVELRPGTMFALEPEQEPHALRVVVGSPETRETLEQGLRAVAGLLDTVPA